MTGVLSHTLAHAAPATVGFSVPVLTVAPTGTPSPTGAMLAANATGGAAPLTYNWSGAGLQFTGVGGSAVANPTAAVAVPGSYAASVTVTDATGATATASITFAVVATPSQMTITVDDCRTGQPVAGMVVWATSDPAGETVASGPVFTAVDGTAKLQLILGGCYYLFGLKLGETPIVGRPFVAGPDAGGSGG